MWTDEALSVAPFGRNLFAAPLHGGEANHGEARPDVNGDTPDFCPVGFCWQGCFHVSIEVFLMHGGLTNAASSANPIYKCLTIRSGAQTAFFFNIRGKGTDVTKN